MRICRVVGRGQVCGSGREEEPSTPSMLLRGWGTLRDFGVTISIRGAEPEALGGYNCSPSLLRAQFSSCPAKKWLVWDENPGTAKTWRVKDVPEHYRMYNSLCL